LDFFVDFEQIGPFEWDVVHHFEHIGDIGIRCRKRKVAGPWRRWIGHDRAVGIGDGGMITGNGPMSITQHEYPVQGQGHRAVDELAPGFLLDTRACIGWLNTIPAGPFPQEMVVEMTGSN
jgi:hypothetical protein